MGSVDTAKAWLLVARYSFQVWVLALLMMLGQLGLLYYFWTFHNWTGGGMTFVWATAWFSSIYALFHFRWAVNRLKRDGHLKYHEGEDLDRILRLCQIVSRQRGGFPIPEICYLDPAAFDKEGEASTSGMMLLMAGMIDKTFGRDYR